MKRLRITPGFLLLMAVLFYVDEGSGMLGWAVLVLRLARLESFGVAYLTPFASNAGRQREGHAVFRVPLPWVKLREDYLNVGNRRNQR